VEQPDGSCKCPRGQEKPGGGCCPKGQVFDVDLGCHVPGTGPCKAGEIRNKNGSCVSLPKQVVCLKGFHLKNGKCVADPIVICDPGTHKENGKCVPDRACPSGFVRDPKTKRCVPAPKPQIQLAPGATVPKKQLDSR
jgi:hypothetical protein